MSYTISEINGVKIYNLSAGKTLPQFFEESVKKKTSLRYNQEYRKRIELIQDFEFPVSSQRVRISEDGQYIVTSGIYPPTVKVFETSELSLKCLRGMNCEIAFACRDRTIEFHAQYGRHYVTRVPKYPRDLAYNPFTCDLLIGGASNEIYRLSLDEGKFLPSFTTESPEVNVMFFSKQMSLLFSGGLEGALELWDYRMRNKLVKYTVNRGQEVTSLYADASGYSYAVGSSEGLLRLYDIRYRDHVLEIQHQYRLPIKAIRFHEESRKLISVDQKIVKIFSKDNGQVFTNIEPKAAINDIELVGNSGLLLMASEDVRIGQYFIPALGPAPKWASFLENITEELEEANTSTVYDEYKFVSHEDLEQLNATHLLGTRYLKPYMHGFLMNVKMHRKLKTISNTFAYEEYQKQEIERRFEEETKHRVERKKENVKVNKELFEALKKKAGKKGNAAEVIEDDRFKRIFTDTAFAIDKSSEAYLLSHPSDRNRRDRRDESDVEQEEVDDDEQAEETGVNEEADNFDGEDQDEGEEDDNDDGPVSTLRTAQKLSYEDKMAHLSKMKGQKAQQMKMLKQSRRIQKTKQREERDNRFKGKRISIPLKKLLKK